ncbi:MAG: TolC family protein [Rikenellaceae bacterium]
MNRLKLCGVVALLFGCSLCYAESLTMTLDECLEYAKQNSITLQQAKLEVDNSEAAELTAKGAFYPSVSGSVSQGLNSYPLSTSTDSKSSYTGSYGVDLNMTLYSGGKNRAQLKQSALGSQMSSLELKEYENSLEVSVTELYVEILYAMEQIAVAENTIELNVRNEEHGRAFLEVGSINKAEFAQLESATVTSRYTLVTAQSQLRNLYVALNYLLEVPQGTQVVVKEPVISMAELTGEIPYANDVYGAALESRPEIQSSKLDVEYAELSEKVAYSGYLPTLTLSAGTGVSHSSASDYTFSGQLRNNFNTSVGLNLSVPIFSRFANRSAVRIAKNNTQSAALSLTQAEKDLYQTIETLYNNATNAKAKYEVSVSLLSATQTSLELIQEQYNVGAKNIIELLTEQDNYNQARQDFLTDKYQLLLNKALLNYYKTNIIKL